MLLKIKKYFSNYIQLQLFINLFSWPILIAWGLPVSIASPLGNFLFTPFLILFLILSLIIFILELLFLPNFYIIYLLEIVTKGWINIANYISNKSLLYLSGANILLLLIPILTIFIISKKRRFLYLILITISLVLFNYFNNFNNNLISIVKNNNKVQVIKINKKLIILDEKIFSLKSSKNFINFKLIPKITKKIGLNNIFAIITLRPNKQTYKSLYYLTKKFNINYIYLPDYKKNKRIHEDYLNKLITLAKKNNTKIIILNLEKYKIKINKFNYIELLIDQNSSKNYYYYKIKSKINCN